MAEVQLDEQGEHECRQAGIALAFMELTEGEADEDALVPGSR